MMRTLCRQEHCLLVASAQGCAGLLLRHKTFDSWTSRFGETDLVRHLTCGLHVARTLSRSRDCVEAQFCAPAEKRLPER